ncbi:MAG: ZIP family metal transporter [Bacilli bacterium]|jgi:ZIP family zinc transporter|nr:ZIP family metal transporter [Bacilli bacterium]
MFGAMNPYIITGAGLLFIFAMTTLGAALIFLFKKNVHIIFHKVFLGFAAGVMLAAVVWGLIIPSLEVEHPEGIPSWLIVTLGIVLGALFLLLIDNLIPHLHLDSRNPEGLKSSFKRSTLLYLAVALHNIPEGLAVGLAFGLAIHLGTTEAMGAAIGLAIGIGLQNFPEGAAVTLPLKNEGFSNKKAFTYGMASGVVEPIFGVIGMFVAIYLSTIMPWMLSFAAGAMLYVIIEELIPEAHLGEHSHLGTFGVISGFILMMVLSILLG